MSWLTADQSNDWLQIVTYLSLNRIAMTILLGELFKPVMHDIRKLDLTHSTISVRYNIHNSEAYTISIS